VNLRPGLPHDKLELGLCRGPRQPQSTVASPICKWPPICKGGAPARRGCPGVIPRSPPSCQADARDSSVRSLHSTRKFANTVTQVHTAPGSHGVPGSHRLHKSSPKFSRNPLVCTSMTHVVIFLYLSCFLGGIYTCRILSSKRYGTNKIAPKNSDVALSMTWQNVTGLLDSFELVGIAERA
jgi:hypothetical protein